MTGTRLRLTACIVGLLAFGSEVPATMRAPASPAPQRGTASAKVELSALWVEPESNRDLYYGVGGRTLAPDPSVTYTIIDTKRGGFSDGYTVRDAAGREWSTKLYPEARTEVVASRLLWGLGYHQPPIYAVEKWTADGSRSKNPQPVARFRERAPRFHGLTEADPWSYSDNPFVGSRPLNGLLVLQIMLGNSDLKADNNRVYTLSDAAEGAKTWYVARDVGQTFGRSGLLNATRDDIEEFDRTRFIRGVSNGTVSFEYYGLHQKLMDRLTVEDVQWICRRLSRLTDKQFSDAFRAGGYADLTAQRYIRRLKIKIREGLALEG